MNRQEAEDFIYKSYLRAEKYQDYNAKDSKKRRPDLTYDLIRARAKTPAVVVTGSKGKGSVAAMVAQVLQGSLKVGLMTSPHLTNFCQRFKVNGRDISDRAFTKYVESLQPEIDQIDEALPQEVCISPMGIQTMIALDFFNDSDTDFNIFECGKGAKNDDVNNVLHQYGIINKIFLEHTRELGKTIEEIASDKAHIITGEQKCVYIATQQPAALAVIQERAKMYGTPLKIYGRDFKATNISFTDKGMKFNVVIGEKIYRDIVVPLMGAHQAENCALALALCQDVLGELDSQKIKSCLNNLVWPGRMQVMSQKPFVLLDACINKASAEIVKDVITHMGLKKVNTIIGIPDDKDYVGVAKAMESISKTIILTKSQNVHYVFTTLQQEDLARHNIESTWIDTVEEALNQAKSLGGPTVILGTTSVVSEVCKIYEKQRSKTN